MVGVGSYGVGDVRSSGEDADAARADEQADDDQDDAHEHRPADDGDDPPDDEDRRDDEQNCAHAAGLPDSEPGNHDRRVTAVSAAYAVTSLALTAAHTGLPGNRSRSA